MALINCTFYDFVRHIKTKNKSIICYGAGMIPLYIEPLLLQYDLLQNVHLFIDSNREKEGKTVSFQDRSIKIAMPDYLKTLDADKYVILITAEEYEGILDKIRNCVDLSDWECYAYPLLNLSFFKSTASENFSYGNITCIPKMIHYTWFGESEKKELYLRCIESWKKQCPDYEILEWNETNYDVHKNRYIEQAYKRKKWAYVSDYARLDILYRYGGIYLDTDVELLRSMDALLTTEAFLCFGEWPVPNSGAGVGCVKGHAIIKEMMETRESIDFIQADGNDDAHTNSNYEMRVLMRHGFHMNFEYQTKAGMTLYPPDVIAPVSVTGKDSFITERSIGIHYCNNSWRNGSGRFNQHYYSHIQYGRISGAVSGITDYTNISKYRDYIDK